MDFLFPYSEQKIKPNIKMAIQRIGIHKNKRSNAVKTQKREIAGFLSDGKEEKAKIRVEHIIREDFAIEGLEILELNLELVHERIKQISNNRECPAELKEAVCSIIWATNNVDIDELKEVTNQLTKKYGKEFAKQAMNNDNNCVNQRLYAKLSYRPPSKLLVKRYLEEIAKIYNVDWTPSPDLEEEVERPFASPSGSSIPMAPGSGLTGAYTRPNVEPPSSNLNAYELEEQLAFLRNQSQPQSNQSSYPPLPPLQQPLPPPNNTSNQGSNTPPVDLAPSEQDEIPLVEARIISSSVPLNELSAAAKTLPAPNTNTTTVLPPPPQPAPVPILPPAPSTATARDDDDASDPFDDLEARLAALRGNNP